MSNLEILRNAIEKEIGNDGTHRLSTPGIMRLVDSYADEVGALQKEKAYKRVISLASVGRVEEYSIRHKFVCEVCASMHYDLRPLIDTTVRAAYSPLTDGGEND